MCETTPLLPGCEETPYTPVSAIVLMRTITFLPACPHQGAALLICDIQIFHRDTFAQYNTASLRRPSPSSTGYFPCSIITGQSGAVLVYENSFFMRSRHNRDDRPGLAATTALLNRLAIFYNNHLGAGRNNQAPDVSGNSHIPDYPLHGIQTRPTTASRIARNQLVAWQLLDKGRNQFRPPCLNLTESAI